MKKRRVWLWALGGFVAFCVAPVLIVGFVTGLGPYDIPVQARSAAGILEESERLGLPMTREELVGAPPPAADNAAPLVIKLAATISTQPTELGPGDPYVPGSVLAAWVENNGNALDGVQQTLATKPRWYVERDYDQMMILAFPEYAQMKNVARAFASRGPIRARAGDVDGATADIVASRDLADRLTSDPTLISLLVSIAMTSLALHSVEDYVVPWKGNAKALRSLEEALEATSVRKDPTNALRGEFYAGLSTCRNLRSMKGFVESLEGRGGTEMDLETKKVVRSGLPKGMSQRALFAVLGRGWNQCFAKKPGDGSTWRDWGLDEAFQPQGQYTMSETIAAIMMPVYAQAESALKRDDVQQDLALAFVRAFRFHAQKGRWPGSLAEIDSEFPDPFAPGQPVRAHFSGLGVRVWSVGINGLDEGGERDGEADDLAFVWPPRRAR